MDYAYLDVPITFTPQPTKFDKRLWKDSPEPPPPQPVPDPSKEIRAQAYATPSAYTPWGSREYSGDPTKPGSFRYTETLSPEQQQQKGARDDITMSLLNRAQYQIPNIDADPFTFDPNNPVTNQYWEAQQGLLDPYFERQQESLDQRLANQGLPMGSEAYTEAMQDFRTDRDRAYQQASAAALDKGYQQALGTRQQNYNELAALLGGQQLQGINYNPGTLVDPSTAYARSQSVRNQNYGNQMGAYNAQVAGQNSLMGGLFGLGGSLGSAAIMASDNRLKRDVEYIGQHNGIPWYSFRYLWENTRRVGVMAQEVLNIKPEAVIERGGWLFVDYGAL